jgi:DNA recombination protein RmuC
MDKVLFSVGDVPVTIEMAAAIAAGVVVLLLMVLLVSAIGSGKQRAAEADAVQQRSADLERQLAGLMQSSYEMSGRMQTMAEIFASRNSDLMRVVNERMDAQGTKVGQVIQETNTKTAQSLNQLNERLAVIDRAQGTITQLSSQVVTLQSILSNKQTRGAFGQGRMEAIVSDGLAAGSFAFQFTLSNNRRPDCVIFMPNGGPKLVVDAKFPLESWQRLADAKTEDETKQARAGFRTDLGYHIKTISENYLIPDETQDTAFMFVPSESIFADIHEHFDDMVQKAMRARVVIVSPSILMLSIQVMQGLLRDVRMREEAHKIQKEVRELLGDVGRLKERVIALQKHFAQANNDIGDILTSTAKVTRRGQKIDELDLDEQPAQLEASLVVERKIAGLF